MTVNLARSHPPLDRTTDPSPPTRARSFVARSRTREPLEFIAPRPRQTLLRRRHGVRHAVTPDRPRRPRAHASPTRPSARVRARHAHESLASADRPPIVPRARNLPRRASLARAAPRRSPPPPRADLDHTNARDARARVPRATSTRSTHCRAREGGVDAIQRLESRRWTFDSRVTTRRASPRGRSPGTDVDPVQRPRRAPSSARRAASARSMALARARDRRRSRTAASSSAIERASRATREIRARAAATRRDASARGRGRRRAPLARGWFVVVARGEGARARRRGRVRGDGFFVASARRRFRANGRARTRTRDDGRARGVADGRAARDRGVVSSVMMRQRETKEAVARRALQEFETQLDEVARATGDATVRARVERQLTRLPKQYAMDVNFIEDVLIHADLLAKVERDVAEGGGSSVYCAAREVEVGRAFGSSGEFGDMMDTDGARGSPAECGIAIQRGDSSSHRNLRAPTFGSSFQVSTFGGDAQGGTYEIAVSAGNKPRLLSRVSAVLFEVGLNIAEAHVFCTDDGYALDIFIVTGWRKGESHAVQNAVQAALDAADFSDIVPASRKASTATPSELEGLEGRTSAGNSGGNSNDIVSIDGGEWELTEKQLVFNEKIASGAFGLLYRGSYCGQEVAIKVLKSNAQEGSTGNETIREFAQELNILRRVHHKHIIQLIGALTKQRTMCLVTEFMHGGNMLQFVQEHALKLHEIIRYALGVAMGLDYLHKINIIHRDIKTANLLLDENNVVKIADFGVARIQPSDGSTMTAETGTYRWMAPEVIAHQFYNEKADVYSFGVMVWELMSGGEVPYPGYTPLQAAVGVVQRGLRPTISSTCNPVVAQVMQHCWAANPTERPSFEQIIGLLKNVDCPRESDGKSGFFDRLRSVSFKSKRSAQARSS